MGLHLLRTEHRGGGEVFVDGGKEFDAASLQERLGAPEFEIDAAERRAAITRDEAGAVDPVVHIAASLIEQDPHQRLRAGEKHPSALPLVAVEQSIIVEVRSMRIGICWHVHPPGSGPPELSVGSGGRNFLMDQRLGFFWKIYPHTILPADKFTEAERARP